MDIASLITSAVTDIGRVFKDWFIAAGTPTSLEVRQEADRLAANSADRAAALSSQSRGTAFTVILLIIIALILAAIILKQKK